MDRASSITRQRRCRLTRWLFGRRLGQMIEWLCGTPMLTGSMRSRVLICYEICLEIRQLLVHSARVWLFWLMSPYWTATASCMCRRQRTLGKASQERRALSRERWLRCRCCRCTGHRFAFVNSHRLVLNNGRSLHYRVLYVRYPVLFERYASGDTLGTRS
jgi:hypothetical protein